MTQNGEMAIHTLFSSYSRSGCIEMENFFLCVGGNVIRDKCSDATIFSLPGDY